MQAKQGIALEVGKLAYNEQLLRRRQSDDKALNNAFNSLVSVVGIKNKEPQPEDAKEAIDKAISDVLSYYGAKAIRVPSEIKDANDRLEYMLRASGVMRRRVELTGKWWLYTSGALLGSTVDGAATAVLPAIPSGYTYYDSESGKRVRVNQKTSGRLNTDAFCFYRALPARKLKLADLAFFMLHSINKTDIFFVLGATLLVSLLGLFTPFMNKQIFDSVIPSGTKSDIFPVAGLLVGAAIGSSLFGITRRMVLTRLRDKINVSVQAAAMARMFSLPAGFFKDYSAGEISTRAMSITRLTTMLSDTVLTTGLTALFSFIYIFQVVKYAPSLVFPGLLSVFAMLAFTVMSSILYQKMYNKLVKLSAKLSGLVYGLFSGVQKVKLAGAEKRAFAKWAVEYSESGRLTYSPHAVLQINMAVAGAITLGGTILLYYFAGVNKVPQSDYIAFSSAFGMVSGAIMSLSGITMTIANVRPLIEMIKPVLDAVPETDESKQAVTSLTGNIDIANVSFRYNKDGPLILDNISIKVKQGEYLAVVGRSGSGKSTLMRILLGFEKPEAGAVYYDGYDLDTLDVRSVRQCIGVALQNGKLFSGDIFSNIIITSPNSTLDDAWKAARMAGLEEDIKAMPMGMHTMIGEGSGGISGGQKQRILIARALIASPGILFFDEATSALDNITQKHVTESLASIGCTRIVIAHRLSTVKNCDRIIVIEGGKITEEGNYDELMEKKGLFYEFAQRQIS